MAPGITDISGIMKAQDDLAFASKSLCDSLKSTVGSDYASAMAPGISSVLETIKVPDYSALDHLDKTEHYPTNLKKIRNSELRLIKPNHSIREDLLLSIKNREDSIFCKYICETLKLLPLCNDAAKIAKKSEIFKPTNKAVDAILDLSLFVPRDKEDFGQFIDKLYTIFYEGAGDDKLRFLQENGGVLEGSECEFIWCISN
jgi:hypothetical protein